MMSASQQRGAAHQRRENVVVVLTAAQIAWHPVRQRLACRTTPCCTAARAAATTPLMKLRREKAWAVSSVIISTLLAT
jgi:hypothetical protein